MTRNDATDTRTRLMDAAEALVLQHGFAGTSIEQVLAETGLTKGAFFHHFPTKAALAEALVARYAERDREHLEGLLGRAERLSRDPLQQVLLFAGLLEEMLREQEASGTPHPGCLFASYCYESQLMDEATLAHARGAIELWRERLAAKLREAAAAHPPRLDVDLKDVADACTGLIEGGLIIGRTMGEPRAVAAQAGQYRSYLELLFGAA